MYQKNHGTNDCPTLSAPSREEGKGCCVHHRKKLPERCHTAAAASQEMHQRPGGNASGVRKLTPDEEEEYDRAARALAHLIFPGEPHKGRNSSPDERREVIEEFRRRKEEAFYDLRIPITEYPPRPKSNFRALASVASRIARCTGLTASTSIYPVVLFIIFFFFIGGHYHISLYSSSIVRRGFFPPPKTLPRPTPVAITSETARHPSNTLLPYDPAVSRGNLECNASLYPRVYQTLSRAKYFALGNGSNGDEKITALFGRGTWNSDHERLVAFGIDAEVMNLDNKRQLNRVHSKGVDVAIMHRSDEYFMMDKIRDMGKFEVAIPSRKAHQVFEDKIAFARWMMDGGLANNIPTVHEDWDERIPTLPVVIKGATGSFGKGVHVIKTEKEWNKTLHIVRRHGKDFLVQDAIASRDEYTHNFAAIHGHLLRHEECFRVSMLADVYVKGKNDLSIRNTTAWERCDQQPHRKAVSEVLHAIINRSCYHGFGCMQYKLGPDGIPKVLEVNPRVCGSLNSRVDRFHKMIRAYLKEYNKVALGTPLLEGDLGEPPRQPFWLERFNRRAAEAAAKLENASIETAIETTNNSAVN